MKQYRCKRAYNRHNFIKYIGLSDDNLNIDSYKDNNMNNDSDWGFYYDNKNSTKNMSNATTDGQYAADADADAKVIAAAYAKGAADGFANGIAHAYAKGYADGQAHSAADLRNQAPAAAQ